MQQQTKKVKGDMGLTTQKNYRLLLYGNTLLIVLFGAVLAGCVLFWLLPEDLGESYGAIMASAKELRRVLIWRVVALYSVISLLIVLGIAILHLFYSHRIAGPVYRLGKEAAKIAQGNLLGAISFRRKDSLTDMADVLNDLTSRYRGRINTAKDCLAVIETHAKTVPDLIRKGKDGDDLKQAMETITKHVATIERSLSGLRT